MRKYYGGDIVWPRATRFTINYIALESLFKKKVDLKKLFEWWMGTTQAQSDKHWTRYGKINVWPSVLG